MEQIKSRRRHSAQFKAQVLSACAQPGASVASVALSYGLKQRERLNQLRL